MKYRTLGQTDIKVSVVCLGGWSLVSDATWGQQEEAASIAAIHASLDAGVNFIDTAELYGGGQSEELLAKALAGRRNKVVLASKVGVQNLHPVKLRQSLEQSLLHLHTDFIDLYQMHWPSSEIPVADSLATMEELKKEGKIRAIGVSNFGVSYLKELFEAGRAESNQLCYSLLWRPIEHEVQPACVKNNMSILCYSPLSQGLLTGKFTSVEQVPVSRARTRLFAGTRPQSRHGQPGAEVEAFAAVEEIRRICRSINTPMGRASLAWLLAQKGVTSVIAGARSAQQALDNAAAGDVTLPPHIIAALSAATQRVKELMGSNADMWQSDSRMERLA